MAEYRLSSPWSAGSLGDFNQLRRNMNEFFDDTGERPRRRGAAYPPVNFHEAEDSYVLTAELPGLEGDAIDVSIEGNRVTLRGERKVEHPQDGSLHRVERQSGVFRRTLELPEELDSEKAEAVYRNGILMLRIPKTAAQQPRRIAVNPS